MKTRVYWATFLLLVLSQVLMSAQGRQQNAGEQKDLTNTAGALHNEGAEFVLQHIQAFPPPSGIRPLVTNLTEEFCATNDLDCGPINLPTVPQSTEQLLATIKGSQKFKNDLRLVFQLIDNIRPNPQAPGLSLNQYEISLTDLQTTLANDLHGPERTEFLSAVSVARMSGLLWAPTEEGGLNGIHFLNTPPAGGAASIDWGAVLKADLIGLLQGGLAQAIGASVTNLLSQLL